VEQEGDQPASSLLVVIAGNDWTNYRTFEATRLSEKQLNKMCRTVKKWGGDLGSEAKMGVVVINCDKLTESYKNAAVLGAGSVRGATNEIEDKGEAFTIVAENFEKMRDFFGKEGIKVIEDKLLELKGDLIAPDKFHASEKAEKLMKKKLGEWCNEIFNRKGERETGHFGLSKQ
jgi:hypothetical protein